MEGTFAMVEKIASDPTVDVTKDPAFASLSPARRAKLAKDDLTLLKGTTVASPYHAVGEPQIATTGPEAGKVAFATVEIPKDPFGDIGNVGGVLKDVLPSVKGLQVELGGRALGTSSRPRRRPSASPSPS